MLPSLLSFTSDANKISMAADMQVKTGRQLQITSDRSMTITGRRVYLESPQQNGSGNAGREESVYVVCTKVMYMLYYGKKAIEQYNYDKKDNPKRYQELMGKATRLLWAEFEHTTSTKGQWHRGVDFYFKRGAQVFSLCNGTLIDNSINYKVSYHDTDEDVTFTYCHMDKQSKQSVTMGTTVIGTESGENYEPEDSSWHDPAVYPAHTHVEINKGYYKGNINISWSTKGYERDKLYIRNFKLGDNMSLNPYPYFTKKIKAWESLCGRKWE